MINAINILLLNILQLFWAVYVIPKYLIICSLTDALVTEFVLLNRNQKLEGNL